MLQTFYNKISVSCKIDSHKDSKYQIPVVKLLKCIKLLLSTQEVHVYTCTCSTEGQDQSGLYLSFYSFMVGLMDEECTEWYLHAINSYIYC